MSDSAQSALGLAASNGVSARPAPGSKPVVPRLAASVLLLRDAEDGFEVFSLLRASTMAFAAGMTAFPGGSVDVSDDSAVLPWHGPDVESWRQVLRSDNAGELVTAAIRELFEETGVLLAGKESGSEDLSDIAVELEAARVEVAAHRGTLVDVFRAQGLRARTDLLTGFANWITPPGSARRFDTFFFLAELPAGQDARLLTTEAESGVWARPADLLERCRLGEIEMFTPTLVLLSQLAAGENISALRRAEIDITPTRPRVVSAPGEAPRILVNGVEYTISRPGGGVAERGRGAGDDPAASVVKS